MNINLQSKLDLLAEFDFTSATPKVKEAAFYLTPGSKITEGS